MKQRLYYLPFIVVLIIVFLLGKKCNSTPVKIDTHEKDSIINALRSDLSTRQTLEGIASSRTDTVLKWKYRWHKAKTIHDTIPCEEKLPVVIQVCDSTLAAYDSLLSTKNSIIKVDSGIIKGYQKLAKIDSLTIDSLTKSRKKFWKGFKLGFTIGIGTGVIGGALVR